METKTMEGMIPTYKEQNAFKHTFENASGIASDPVPAIPFIRFTQNYIHQNSSVFKT